MMNLQQELDALIESTLAFANSVKRRQPIADVPVALRMAEQALAEHRNRSSRPSPLRWRQSATKSDSASAISKRIRKKWHGSARTITCK